jgi:hypothetical protein
MKEFLNSFNESCEPIGHITFRWSSKGVGFGTMSFYLDPKDGYVHCGNEIMSRQFLKDMLCKMVDNAVMDEYNDRHADNGPGGLPPGYVPKPLTSVDD